MQCWAQQLQRGQWMSDARCCAAAAPYKGVWTQEYMACCCHVLWRQAPVADSHLLLQKMIICMAAAPSQTGWLWRNALYSQSRLGHVNFEPQ